MGRSLTSHAIATIVLVPSRHRAPSSGRRSHRRYRSAVSTWCLVLAAGAGERFGGPKQFAPLGRRRVVDKVVASAIRCSDGVVVLVPAGHRWDGADVDRVVTGGAEHRDSVRNGLAALPDDVDLVVVAPASHPLASDSLHRAVIAAVTAGVDAAAPVLASADAIKRIDGDVITGSVDKTDLVIVQAPSAFRRSSLAAALDGGAAPEELELIERWGGRVVTVAGEATNIHIASPADLAMAEAVLALTSTL